jgi:catechol 2,3-dioxygenase-like lactoylglutathione lyase family enzyme
VSITINKLRPFVPAKDFATSKQFYEALGFTVTALGRDIADVSFGSLSFLLQDYYVEDWAHNFMMHAMVDDLDAWWRKIDEAKLADRFAIAPPREPAMQPWGLRVAYVVDPSGVLWHFADQG